MPPYAVLKTEADGKVLSAIDSQDESAIDAEKRRVVKAYIQIPPHWILKTEHVHVELINVEPSTLAAIKKDSIIPEVEAE